MTCNASPAKSEESGLPIGPHSSTPGLEDCLILLAARIEAQAEAIQAMAESVMILIDTVSQDMGDGDAPSTTYMDGSPIR